MRVGEREDEWIKVNPRRRKDYRPKFDKTDKNKYDRHGIGNGGTNRNGRFTDTAFLNNGTVSYYVTNFLEDWHAEALWKMFCRWGFVIDLYIPLKKNREGKRFGFVRFKNVQDPRVLEYELKQIRIGGAKLEANIARFGRMDNKESIDSEKKIPRQKERKTGYWHNSKTIPGVKYAEVVKGGRNMQWRKKNEKDKKGHNSDEWNCIEHFVEEEDMAWLKRCYVGKFTRWMEFLICRTKSFPRG